MDREENVKSGEQEGAPRKPSRSVSLRMNLLIPAETTLGKPFLVFKLSISGCSVEVGHPETGELHQRGRERMAPGFFLPGRSHPLPEKVMLNPS